MTRTAEIAMVFWHAAVAMELKRPISPDKKRGGFWLFQSAPTFLS